MLCYTKLVVSRQLSPGLNSAVSLKPTRCTVGLQTLRGASLLC